MTKEYKREYAKLWRSKNSQKFREIERRKYLKHKDRIVAYAKGKYMEDPKRHMELNREWRRRNPERKLELARRVKHKLKREVIAHYGNQCDCCGEDKIEFLAVDHICGAGNKHRASLKTPSGKTKNFYTWLRQNNYPPEFRILCHNCNFAIGHYGQCPHTPLTNEVLDA